MLIIGSILLLLANAVTLRREKSIFFNRVAILILLYSGILAGPFDSLYIGSLDTGIGVFCGVFHHTLIATSLYFIQEGYEACNLLHLISLQWSIAPFRAFSILHAYYPSEARPLVFFFKKEKY